MNITIFKKNKTLGGDRDYDFLDFKSFIFPGGEIGIKLDANNLRVKYNDSPYVITARLQNSVDVFSLALIKDAIERFDNKAVVELIIPYIPYARQDRVCAPGESFSLKVFANFINSLNFSKVTVFDPHSDVTAAVFNNLVSKTQLNIISNWAAFNSMVCSFVTVLISPDAGANKKTSEIAKYFAHDKFVRADKLRDMQTGNIKETIVYSDDLSNCQAVITDDLIDAGGTFIALAKELKKKNAAKVILYATHGIFSKGVNNLLDNGIDEIWTTDSFRQDLVETDRLHILKI